MRAAIVFLLWALEGAAPAPTPFAAPTPYAPPPSYAAPPPLPPVAPVAPAGLPLTSLRANLSFAVFDYVGIGADVGHSFDRHFAFETSANFVSLPNVDSGFYGEALARAGHFGSRSSVSFGLGPGFLYTSDFGPVAFAVPEVAYELRKRGSVSFLAGFGVPVVLNQSRQVLCSSPEFLGCLFDRLQYHRGDVLLRSRVAIGYAF